MYIFSRSGFVPELQQNERDAQQAIYAIQSLRKTSPVPARIDQEVWLKHQPFRHQRRAQQALHFEQLIQRHPQQTEYN